MKHNKRYFRSCVNWDRSDVGCEGGLSDMIDSSQSITRHTFLSHVDRADYKALEKRLGYIPGSKPTMARDYLVAYYKGKLHGKPTVWITQSAIEYVFM